MAFGVFVGVFIINDINFLREMYDNNDRNNCLVLQNGFWELDV